MFVRRISSKKFQWVKEEYWSIRELIFYGCRARLGWNLPYNYKRARPELHDVVGDDQRDRSRGFCNFNSQ